MNLFLDYQKKIFNSLKDLEKKKVIQIPLKLKSFAVELPPKNQKADISCNAAMILAKINNSSPLKLAEVLKKHLLSNFVEFKSIEIAGSGFLNIYFHISFWRKYLAKVIELNANYGSNKVDKKKYNVEFVSANPTGPLHVGHCRGAVLGDVISNLLRFNQHSITREYYVNDYGNQIINFTKSVYLRIREILNKEKFPTDDPDLYPGDYIISFAENIIKENKKLNFDNFKDISENLTKLSVEQSIKLIKFNLENLGITHDNFASERDLVNNNEVQKALDKLKNNNLVYEGKIKAPGTQVNSNWVERKQLLFKSTEFGDDKDRSLKKSDNTWTYFANDVAYHNNKLNRKFDFLINILGADHAGYIKRITSAVEALSGKKYKLICKVSQLVKLIKDGKTFKMSKRKGDYITVEDLINEVGKDATRFIMLNRSSDVELEFDFTKVKEKSKDNPLYYVQYCYARISSVFRHIGKNINDEINVSSYNFNYSSEEIKILRKISEYPKCIDVSLNKLEPHRIPVYLCELASEFHSYWNMGKNNEDKRFINKEQKVSDDKLIFL